MYVEDPKTTLQNGVPTVLDADVCQWTLDAKPVDLWDAWLFAAAESNLMLQAWSVAATDRTGAYVGYRSALDREEQAALVLAQRLSTWQEAA
jgi:hypothetical protein